MVGGDSFRYLILVAPYVILCLGMLEQGMAPVVRRGVIVVLIASTAVSCANAAVLTRSSWGKRPGYAYARDVHDFMVSSGYRSGYASINTALSVSYLFPGGPMLLPIGCDPGAFVRSTLFYDKSVFDTTVTRARSADSMLVFDGMSIINTSNICDVALARSQFGEPLTIYTRNDGSAVYVYRQLIVNNTK